jgi:hypothetical protein
MPAVAGLTTETGSAVRLKRVHDGLGRLIIDELEPHAGLPLGLSRRPARGP